jgi:hypothetical protein
MADLIESLNRLRADNPEVASALKRAREGNASSDDSNYYHSAQSFPASAQSNGTDTKQFLEGRDRDRDNMGVGNWVFKHRDEIAAGDAERLAKRLEAEQNYAAAQNAIEGFKRDSASALPSPGMAILSAGDSGGISLQPDISRPAPPPAIIVRPAPPPAVIVRPTPAPVVVLPAPRPPGHGHGHRDGNRSYGHGGHGGHSGHGFHGGHGGNRSDHDRGGRGGR